MGDGIIIRGFHEEEGAIDLTADKWGKDLIVQGPEHYMVHEGKHFTLMHYFSDVDGDEYARIRFLTPADVYYHAIFFCSASAGVLISVYRDSTFTHNAANAITAYNKNDISSNIDPTIEACHTPSGSGSGDVFIPIQVLGAGGNPSQVGAGSGRDANEVILKKSTVYLLEVQSLADNNKVSMGMDFYYRP